MPGQYFKLSLDRFLPYPLKFINNPNIQNVVSFNKNHFQMIEMLYNVHTV
jgi:hypothetical protein